MVKGTVMGLNLTHTKAHLYRSMLEGVAYALRDNMEIVIGRYHLDEKVKLVGGAAKADLWSQIFSDVTNFKIETIKEEVEAPLGDAFLAAQGVGLVDDPKYLEHWFTLEDRAEPIAENAEVYNKLFAEYRNIYQQTKDIMARLGK